MKRTHLVLILFLLLPALSLSQKKMSLAILDFQPKGISKAESQRISEWLRTEMINTGNFIMIERSMMKDILKEQSFQLTVCTDTSCAVKVGKLLSARKILIGSIDRWGKKIIINGRIIDVEKGVAEFAHRETIASMNDLDVGLNFFAVNLCRRIKGLPVIRHREPEKSPVRAVISNSVDYLNMYSGSGYIIDQKYWRKVHENKNVNVENIKELVSFCPQGVKSALTANVSVTKVSGHLIKWEIKKAEDMSHWKQYKGFRLIECELVTLNGKEALKYVFSDRMTGPVTHKNIAYSLFNSGHWYYVGYKAKEGVFDKYLKEATEILETFSFK